MKLIFLSLRIASYLIDLLVYLASILILGKLSFWSLIISLGVLFLYRISTSYFLGETPGMKALGLTLSHSDFRTVVKREIYRIASAPFYIGYLFAFWGNGSRCLHDYMANVNVIYVSRKDRSSKTFKPPVNKDLLKNKPKTYMRILSAILMTISIYSFTTGFLMNHIGMIGFSRKYTSNEFYRHLDSESSAVKSQEGLFKSTIGIQVTSMITVDNKDNLIRISPKDNSTEVYKMNSSRESLNGQYMYTLPFAVEYIDSVKINGQRLLTYLTKDKLIHIVDENGKIIYQGKSTLQTPIDLKVGYLNGVQSIVVLCTNGYVEVFHIEDNILPIYTGKIGEDVIPEQFLVDDNLYILANTDSNLLYRYSFNKGLNYISKTPVKINGASIFEKITLNGKEYFLYSDVKTPNMMFNSGKIQTSKILTKDGKEVYNLGGRQGALYNYKVKQVDNVLDIDSDGKDDIILKSVDKNNVTGDSYSLSVYHSNSLLEFNKVLTKLLDIFSLPI